MPVLDDQNADAQRSRSLSLFGCLCSCDDEMSKSSMTEGRGSGRLARRQKRLEKLRAKEAIAREERQARKELVKVSFSAIICPGPSINLLRIPT